MESRLRLSGHAGTIIGLQRMPRRGCYMRLNEPACARWARPIQRAREDAMEYMTQDDKDRLEQELKERIAKRRNSPTESDGLEMGDLRERRIPRGP